MTITIIVVALLVAVLAIWQTVQLQAMRKKVDAVPSDGNTVAMLRAFDERAAAVSRQVASLEGRVAGIEMVLPHAITRTGVVEFNAFGNITGNLSRSIALLSERGDGIVLTLLTARDETIFYTKAVRAGKGVQELSPEERASVDRAMGR